MDLLQKFIRLFINKNENSELHTNDAFRYIWVHWRILGMHPTSQYRYLYYCYAVVLNLFGPLICSVPMITFFFMDSPSLLVIVRDLSVLLAVIVSTMKQYTIWIMKQRLLNCKPILDVLDLRANENIDEETYLKKAVTKALIIYWIFFFMMNLTLLAFIFAGIFLRKFPIDAWYPFRYFIYGFMHQVFGITCTAIQQTSSDVYPLSYISIITAHMHALRMRLQKIEIPSATNLERNCKTLENCIQDHININRLIKQVSPVISATIFIQFTVTAIIVCNTAVGITISNYSGMQYIATTMFLGAVIAEIFPVCYFANQLIEETENLKTSIFHCNWIGQSFKFQKNILMFMQRTQLSNIIVAGNIFPITLPTVVQILKFSVSLFAIINEVGN